MQRNSIQLSPKSVPISLRQDNNDDNYRSFASTSRFHTEDLTSTSTSYSSDLNCFYSPSNQSSKDASLSERSREPLKCDIQDEKSHSPQNQTRNNSILSRIWNPCSGGCSIGEQLDCIDYPISYRDLVYRWIALERPTLENIRIPLDMQTSTAQQNSNLIFFPESMSSLTTPDLQEICEAQEKAIIESITSYLEFGRPTKVNSFRHFASHLDVYSAVNAELVCLEDGLPKDSKNISRYYDEIWWNTLQAFDLDRSVCTARTPHNCFRYLLWGEVYTWPLEDIIDKFQIYKNRSSIIKPVLLKQFKQDMSGLLNSFSTPYLSTQSPLGGEKMVPSPSLSTHMSTLELSDFVAGVDVKPFETPISLDGFTSFWQSDTNSETPSGQTNSTPARSPLCSEPQDEILKAKHSKYEDSSELITSVQSDLCSQEIYPIHSFDLLSNVHESAFEVSSLKSPFSGTTSKNWKTSRPLSQSALDGKSHTEIFHTNLTVSTPVTPSTGSSTLVPSLRGQKRQMSNFNQQECDLNNDPASIYKLLQTLGQFGATQESDSKDAQQFFDFMNTSRRESSSSIGSSFGDENALEKTEKYKKLLHQAATQLGTAARLLSVQASNLQPSHEVQGNQDFMPSANISPAISHYSSTTSKRAKFSQGGNQQRPFRPRSQTTS